MAAVFGGALPQPVHAAEVLLVISPHAAELADQFRCEPARLTSRPSRGFPSRGFLHNLLTFRSELLLLFVVPSLFTNVWLWLYAGSGFLLKAARRFDIGFEWFNRKFDIEKKPLQSIGLVAGALVAVAYWTAVIVSRVVG